LLLLAGNLLEELEIRPGSGAKGFGLMAAVEPFAEAAALFPVGDVAGNKAGMPERSEFLDDGL